MPGELAADAEAAEVAAQDDLFTGMRLMSDAGADEWVEPIDDARPGYSTRSRDDQTIEIRGAGERQVNIELLAPVTNSAQQLKRGVGLARTMAQPVAAELAHGARLDDPIAVVG